MSHIVLKPAKRIPLNFDIIDTNDEIKVPQLTIDFKNEYYKSEKLSDDFGFDLRIGYSNELISAFDYNYNSTKYIIPEVNPIQIFYSNGIMSLNKLEYYKEELFKHSQEVRKLGKENKYIHNSHFAFFFQFATNVIINFQASLECFLNYSIPKEHKFTSVNEKLIRNPSIHDKLENLEKIKDKKFSIEYPNEYCAIKTLISFRNNLIHLKPYQDSASKYRNLFRESLDIDYNLIAHSLEKYLNFFNSGLIENCKCGKDYNLEIVYK